MAVDSFPGPRYWGGGCGLIPRSSVLGGGCGLISRSSVLGRWVWSHSQDFGTGEVAVVSFFLWLTCHKLLFP